MLLIQALFIFFDKERKIKAAVTLLPLIAFFVAGHYPELGLIPTYIFENLIVFQVLVCKNIINIVSGARLSQIY